LGSWDTSTWADDAAVVLFDPHEDEVLTNGVCRKAFKGKPFIVALSPDKANCKKLKKDTEDIRRELFMGPMLKKEAEAI